MSNSRTQMLGLSGSAAQSNSGASDKRWKNSPTTVMKPTNAPRNPYDPFARSAGGNPNRARTFAPESSSAHDHIAKKRRLQNDPTFGTARRKQTTLLKSKHFNETRNPPSVEEIIDVDADGDEDGENVAASTSMISEMSDELNIRSRLDNSMHVEELKCEPSSSKIPFEKQSSDANIFLLFKDDGYCSIVEEKRRKASSATTASEKQSAFIASGEDMQSKASSSKGTGRALPQDGDSSLKLREKIAGNGIQHLDCEKIIPKRRPANGGLRDRSISPNRQKPFSHVNVQEKAKLFERNSQSGIVETRKEDLKPKHLEFIAVTSKVQLMKGKTTTTADGSSGSASLSQGINYQELGKRDPLATSLTEYVKELILDKWIWGSELYTERPGPHLRYYIRICSRLARFELYKHPEQSQRKLRKFLKLEALRYYEMQYSSPSQSDFQAVIHLNPINPGNGQDPISLKFSKDCTKQDYDWFLELIRDNLLNSKSATVLIGSNVSACWQSALQSAKFGETRCSTPKPDVVEAAPLDYSEVTPLPMATIDKDEAQERVDDTLEVEIPSAGPSEPRRSARQSETSKAKNDLPPNSDELILVYPFSGPGAVHVTNGDVNRLEPQQFLNDTLIELGLKLMMNDLKQKRPELAEDVHVFSSFFYKKLDPKRPEKGHESLRKWTARIDLFKKKYIIIPINENVHWYLAIIYRPEFILSPPHAKPPLRPPLSTRQSRRSQLQLSTSSASGMVDDSGEASTREAVTGTTFESHSVSNEDEDDPIEDADQSDTVGTPALISPPVSQGMDEDEEMTSVMQRTNGCSLENTEEEDVTDVEEISDMLGRTEGGGPSSADETIPDSEEDEGQSSRQRHDAIVIDDDEPAVARDPSPAASCILMDVDELEEEAGKAAPSAPSARVSEDRELASTSAQRGSSSSNSGVPPASFYSKAPRELRPFPMFISYKKPESKASRSSPQPAEADAEVEAEADPKAVFKDQAAIDLTSAPGDPLDDKTTYIFTLDSLGSKHPQAWKLIGDYLKFEAKDKKGVEVPNPAKGKLVDVPTQPNYCDCGLYLLHFAQTFLEDPERLASTILQPKARKAAAAQHKELWKDDKVKSMREGMTGRIMAESARWRQYRDEMMKEEEERNKEKEGGDDDGSDDEIIIEDVKMAVPSPKKPRTYKAQKGRKSVANVPPPRLHLAERLR